MFIVHTRFLICLFSVVCLWRYTYYYHVCTYILCVFAIYNITCTHISILYVGLSSNRIRVCPCISVYARVCPCMFVMSVYVRVCSLCPCMFVYVHVCRVCPCLFVYVRACSCMFVYVRVCSCMSMYAVYVRVCSCMSMYAVYVRVCPCTCFYYIRYHTVCVGSVALIRLLSLELLT